jgi:hypothetical protein
MTEREKLVELFRNAFAAYGDGITGCTREEFFADFIAGYDVTVQEWIPVTERLPDEKGEYLVAFHPCWWDDVREAKTVVGTDTFRGKTTWAKKKFQRVTHWMPLPEPPKEDGDPHA